MTVVLDENQKLSPSVAIRTQLPPAKVLLMNDFEPCVRHWKADAVDLRPLSCFSSSFSITNIPFPSVIGNEIRYPARMPSLYLTQFRVVLSEFP